MNYQGHSTIDPLLNTATPSTRNLEENFTYFHNLEDMIEGDVGIHSDRFDIYAGGVLHAASIYISHRITYRKL